MLFRSEGKNLAIDFDGVIHTNHLGYYDGTIYGTPIQGVDKALKILSTEFTLIIFTAKAKTTRPLVDGKNGVELIWEWLRKYKLAEYIKEVTSEKPRAFAYVDDKAIRFDNWDLTLKEIQNFRIKN